MNIRKTTLCWLLVILGILGCFAYLISLPRLGADGSGIMTLGLPGGVFERTFRPVERWFTTKTVRFMVACLGPGPLEVTSPTAQTISGEHLQIFCRCRKIDPNTGAVEQNAGYTLDFDVRRQTVTLLETGQTLPFSEDKVFVVTLKADLTLGQFGERSMEELLLGMDKIPSGTLKRLIDAPKEAKPGFGGGWRWTLEDLKFW